MIPFPLSMAMLALCLFVWRCTANEPDDGNDDHTRSGGGGGPGPEGNEVGTARTEGADEEKHGEDKAASLTVTTTTAENKASGTTGGTDSVNSDGISSPDVDTDKSGPADSSTSSSSSSSSSSVANKDANGADLASSHGVAGDPLSAPSIHTSDPISGAHSSPSTVSGPHTGDNLDRSDDPERRAVTNDGRDGKLGAGSTGGSTHNTPTGGSASNTPLGTGGVPLSHFSTAGSGGSLTQSGIAKDTDDRNTDSSTNKFRDQNKDQLQDNTGNQADNDASQTHGNTGRSPTSSAHTGANKETQDKMAATSTAQKQDQQDTSTSADVNQKGATTNNNKQQIRDQGNRGTPTDPNTVRNVPTTKGATKTPKPEPVLTTGTGSKINSTTTTTMAEDIQQKYDANETSKTPTTILEKQTKTLGQLQTLVKNDSSSSKPLLFAFATLITLAVVSVVPVS